MEVIEASGREQTRKRSRKKDDLPFEEKYLAKLERYRNHMAKVRLNETPEQYKARLERARTHAAKSRRNETPEQRAARLERARIYKLESRRNETPEQRTKRLENARKQTLKYRQKETPEQREARLERARIYNYHLRHNETPEQREARLEYTRRYMTQMRKYKIFTGMINQADRDQWGALQVLMNPTIKKYSNAYNLQQQLHKQITDGGLHNNDESIESSIDLDSSQQWSPIVLDGQLPNGQIEIKQELLTNNTSSPACDYNENELPSKPEEKTDTSGIFLFNSITSDIPPLQHEVEMVLNYKVINKKQIEHPCPQCKKVYRYTHSLKKHLMLHHSVK